MKPHFPNTVTEDVAEVRDDVRMFADELGKSSGAVQLFPAENDDHEFAVIETAIPHGQNFIPQWRAHNQQDGVIIQTKPPDADFLYLKAIGLLRVRVFTAGNGPASPTLTGAVVGDAVVRVIEFTDGTSPITPTDVTADFEAVITVADQIQQSAGARSGHVCLVFLTGKVKAGLEVF